jgi:hypothetical protein
MTGNRAVPSARAIQQDWDVCGPNAGTGRDQIGEGEFVDEVVKKLAILDELGLGNIERFGVSAKRRDSVRLLVCASPASCSTVTCVCSLLCVHSSKRESEVPYGVTRKGTLLESVPPGVTTWTVPVAAPAGTLAEIAVPEELMVNGTAVPLNVTLVAPVRLVPRIVKAAPTPPKPVCVSTNGPRPVDRLKTVPLLSAPPEFVVP